MDAGAVETLPHSHDVLAVSFRPDGKAVACSTLDGCIHIWNPLDGEIMVRHASDPQHGRRIDALQSTSTSLQYQHSERLQSHHDCYPGYMWS